MKSRGAATGSPDQRSGADMAKGSFFSEVDEMKTRIISGAVLAAIALAAILIGGVVLVAVLLFCAVVGMYELMKALGVFDEGTNNNAVAAAAFAGAVVYYILLGVFHGKYFGETAAIVVIAVMAVYVACFPKLKSEQAVFSCFSFLYVGFMLSFIYLIRIEEGGIVSVWLVFLSSWVADTAAYFTGMKLGKHKMTPVLSPKKTWEGAIGGIVGAGAAGILFSVLFDDARFPLEYLLICMVGAVISIFGDLAASAIKREKGIKDYGTLIPGHGGIMDRFDSVIFVAPGIYFLTRLFLTRGL